MLTLVASSFAVGLVEVGLQMSGYIPAYGDPTVFRVTGDGRKYGLTPHWAGWFAGTAVQINGEGLRNPEIPSAKEPGEYRIIVLGDSVTFGHGVEEVHTFARLLERKLQSARPFWRLRVINAGVPGYNTMTELSQVQTMWPILQPDFIVVGYLVDNDSDLKTGIEVDPRTGRIQTGFSADTMRSRLTYFLHRHSRAYNFVSNRVRILFAEANSNRESLEQDPFSSQHSGWQASRHAIEHLHNLCKERGVPLLVGGMGFAYRVHGLDALSSFLSQHGIPYVELWRTMDVREYFGKYAVAVYDPHPNAMGHQLIASRLEAAILRLIPESEPRQIASNWLRPVKTGTLSKS